MPYAVVDFETTGILPSLRHRAVEIGITHVDDDGEITGRWETLINPARDLGAQRIHGITAAELLDAPTFGDIAVDVIELLRDRTFVAHNATFDERFLYAEFEHAGKRLGARVPSLRTMRLGEKFGLGASCSLAYACGTFHIENEHAHSAGADAAATAELLAAYMQTSRTWPGWGDYWAQAGAAGRGFRYPEGWSSGVVWKARGEISPIPPHFLERISTSAVRDVVEGAESDYLALLDRCLLDRVISVSEADHLAHIADELGLTRAAVSRLHVSYYRALVREAWSDRVLAIDEKTDLEAVADLLQLPAEDRSTADPRAVTADPTPASTADVAHFALQEGDMIVLTGEMSRERSDWEADLHDRGLQTHPNVTKKVKLVVAADPDSLSGKARKAREYGIPIVDEAGLVRLLAGRARRGAS